MVVARVVDWSLQHTLLLCLVGTEVVRFLIVVLWLVAVSLVTILQLARTVGSCVVMIVCFCLLASTGYLISLLAKKIVVFH